MKTNNITLEDLYKDSVVLDNGCIVWMKSRSKAGYGQKAVNGSKEYTHRLACQIKHGKGEPKQEVLHSCDNPPCLNPDHLRWGTRKQNVADMIQRGRSVLNPVNGEKNGMAKLSKEDVLEIRILHGRGFILTDLAQIYGVTAAQIHLIVTRKLWKEIPEIGQFFTR
jgi:hypothetical protein